MDRIKFSVNGREYSVGSEVSSDVTLVDYLREYLELRGTKYMCREGGCGACVVAVTARDPYTGHPRTFSVNSCLTSVTQCQDWEITTIEEIGNRLKGYHPIQRVLAENNGSQCGYCSVGWVMAMYSLLKSRNNDVTEYEVEDSFGSNTCRCTGYRPILKAFRSFAKDAPKPNVIGDIEDLKICDHKDSCESPCKESDWCFVAKDDLEDKILKVQLKDQKVWYRVNDVKHIFEVLNQEGYDSYMLVAGNTGRGAYHIFEFPRVLIDIASISELQQYTLDQNLVLGAGTSLTDALNIFQKLAREQEEFRYLQKFYDHWKLVAHIPVRNIGTIAGNLMVKHRVPTFASDIFLLLETVGATLTIMDRTGKIVDVTPEDFIGIEMVGRVIINVKLPPLSENYKFVSFKIMPRYQNAHAQVNAAFLYYFKSDKETIISARIVMGGLSKSFVHAKQTENFLTGKKIFTNEVLQAALKVLDHELVVEYLPGELKPEFRRKSALGLFYKANITLIPKEHLDPRYCYGIRDFRKSRPLSKASEVYDTNHLIWPITEPFPKVEALIQCAGEAKYTNDLPKQPQEVFAAFVTADVGKGEILSMDPSPALKLQGVLAFFTAKDIPGINSFMPSNTPNIVGGSEEILSSGKITYYDQAIGIIVAENEEVANRAALLVNVNYKTSTEPPMLTINDVKQRNPSRITIYKEYPAREKGTDLYKVIKGCENIHSQYFFTMEPQTCVARQCDDGIEVLPATQYLDAVHGAVSEALNLEQSRVNASVARIGGGFGSKLTRSLQIHTACAMVAYLMNRPCRFVMHIQPNMRVCGKRLPCTRDFEMGVNKSGEIQYLEYQLYTDNGYVYSEPIVSLIPPCIKNVYNNIRWQYKVYNVLTDTASNSWCRSPGSLEAIAMTEYVMEHISYALSMDPLEVRMNNINPKDTDLMEIITTIVEDSEYHKRKIEAMEFNKANRWKKRGIRIALMSWANVILAGHNFLLSVFHIDGTVAVSHGGVEIGQGLNTKVIQAVAYTLNIPMDKVKVKPNDVLKNPNTNATGASSTSESCCFGAIKCCQILLDRLKPIKEKMNNPSWVEIIRAAFLADVNLQTSYRTTDQDLNSYRVAGAAIAEVELDMLTGESEIRRVDIMIDAGSSVNPEIDIGQVEGGFIMGMGYWTCEHLIYDQQTGELLTDRSWNYQVPLAKDIPLDFRVQLKRNSYNSNGVLGARAINEASTCLPICVAFALREAIAASREDTGRSTTDWFDVDGPYTLEQNVLAADVQLEEFVYRK